MLTLLTSCVLVYLDQEEHEVDLLLLDVDLLIHANTGAKKEIKKDEEKQGMKKGRKEWRKKIFLMRFIIDYIIYSEA